MSQPSRIDPPPRIFDVDVFIGEGVQAELEIVIDLIAVKGRAEAPAPRARQLPGQTEIQDV